MIVTFDDFDAWGATVSGAHLHLACDSFERRKWSLGILDLGGVVLQLASEGGGNVCYGGNTHLGPQLFVPLDHVAEHIVNGEPLDDDSLFAIPRGADFSIRVRRKAHSWCSIALPSDDSLPEGPRGGSVRIACRPGTVQKLRKMAGSIAASLLDQPAGTAAHRAAGRELSREAASCLAAAEPPQPASCGRHRIDRRMIVRRSMEAIDAATTLPTAAELARRAGVNGRTLLRAFHETYGMPPKRYLLLRELHRIRRELAAGAPDDATVAEVLSRHGIWEFGRFAGRYRSHFGELPSATLNRARA